MVGTPLCLINLVLVLDKGPHYVAALTHTAQIASFRTAMGRDEARRHLAELVAPSDILDGFIELSGGQFFASQIGNQAQQLWRNQMRQVEIEPDTLNVSSPRLNIQRIGPSPGRAAGDGVCLVGIVATVEATLPIQSGGAAEARQAWGRLDQATNNAFYFYYAPNTTEALNLSEAQALLRTLNASS